MDTTLFKAHIETLQERYQRIFAILVDQGNQLDGVFIHSGIEDIYFGDDNHMPFKAFGHFLQWLPVNRPDQAVLFQPGRKPVYFQVIPTDFWYDQTVSMESWWADCFDIVRMENRSGIFEHLPSERAIAFLGRDTEFAAQLGFPSTFFNLPALMHRLDWERAYKTDYEISCMREANKMAVEAHGAARDRFFQGGSELDVHLQYLATSNCMEHESPYMNIVAFDRNSAILHYQFKDTVPGHQAQVMLIDAGCTCGGYASDLTRTYARESAHPVFKELVKGVDRIQLDLVKEVEPGVSYVHIHEKAHEMVLDLLIEQGVVKGDRADLEKDQISSLFFPHGIGHLLGLQVHDVAGHCKNPEGELLPPPENHPFLRMTRTMEPGMVFTIEPGLYFIPVLLEPERNSSRGAYLNWELIDALIPFGGVRVEDNILVTKTGAENLTR